MWLCVYPCIGWQQLTALHQKQSVFPVVIFYTVSRIKCDTTQEYNDLKYLSLSLPVQDKVMITDRTKSCNFFTCNFRLPNKYRELHSASCWLAHWQQNVLGQPHHKYPLAAYTFLITLSLTKNWRNKLFI